MANPQGRMKQILNVMEPKAYATVARYNYRTYVVYAKLANVTQEQPDSIKSWVHPDISQFFTDRKLWPIRYMIQHIEMLSGEVRDRKKVMRRIKRLDRDTS